MTTVPAALPLVVRTTRLNDPGPLLHLLPAGGSLAWVRRGEGLVAWGETLRISSGGPNRFTDAEQAWAQVIARSVIRDEVRMPGCGPVAFGSFAFSGESRAGGILIVPEVIIGHRAGTWWVTTMQLGAAVPGPPPRIGPQQPVAEHGAVTYRHGARSSDEWSDVVANAIKRIGDGAVEKVVLARDLRARTRSPIDPRRLLDVLADRYPGCWTFSVDGLLGATPEMLVRLERGLVTSRVLAGTIRRSNDDAHDLGLAASLARSSKDLEEHEYAVRSVADALAPHCTTTNVPEAPFVLHLANVMHLATDVTGVLATPIGSIGSSRRAAHGPTSLRLAAALHPSAAVCGTPTAAAAALIDEVEGMDRDRYAGPVGWMDAAGDGEWGIALRCARLDAEDPHEIRLFAGCGIVAGSDPEAELAESNAKLMPMREALGAP